MPRTTIILLVALLMLIFQPASAQEGKQDKYTAEDLGIILQKHPESPKMDFGKPESQNEKPYMLSGSISTKVEAVEIADAGSYAVEVASGLSIVDKKRKKLIPLEAIYPKEDGSYPVIVFSHASIASARDYRPLAAYWASHGYITLLPTHADALTLHIKPGDKVSVFKLIKLSKNSPKSLNDRKEDIRRTLDSLLDLPEKITGLKGKINKEKVAVIGHHSGAFACQLLSGVLYKNKIDEDPRVDAAIYFKGVNWRLPVLKKQSWSNVKIPTMLVSFSNGVKDVSKLRKKFQNAISNTESSDNYFVTIDSTKRLKPSRKKIRRMLKDSNITLISFRPFKKLRDRRKKRADLTDGNSSAQVNDANLDELPGKELLGLLGITPLDRRANSTERFKFAMSTTLPFLNTFLKDSEEDRKILESSTEKHFDDDIVVKVVRL